MARMTPETRTRLEAFKAVKVKHPRLEEVDQQVTQAIDEHAGYTHLLLYGPSGVGKSTVIRRRPPPGPRPRGANRSPALGYGHLCTPGLLPPGLTGPQGPCGRPRTP